jgi:glycosyltransferase involved in cell wall biosynthesis
VKLSILMPAYNEESTILEVAKRVLDVPFPCDTELVIVDDGSHDSTYERLSVLNQPGVQILRHHSNQGKGAAVRTAAENATGDYIVICDADAEYFPEDLPSLLQPIIRGESQVVFGTRTFGSHTAYSFWYVVGNKTVTMAANVLFNSWLSDLETCYKVLPRDLFLELDVRSAGFGMEAELTGKLLARGLRPFEIPIRYRARSRHEGKKLTWQDGVEALWILARTRAAKRTHSAGR